MAKKILKDADAATLEYIARVYPTWSLFARTWVAGYVVNMSARQMGRKTLDECVRTAYRRLYASNPELV